MDNNKNSSVINFDPEVQKRAADPLNSSIPAQNAAQVDDSIVELEDELGGTGTYIFDGFLTKPDPNPDWSGYNRTRIADEMRLTDATIRLGLDATKHPILAANWYVKPGKGEEDDGEKTSLVREELMNNPNFFFRQFMYSSLLFCDYGNMGHEKIFRKRADGKIGWKKFAPRLPHTYLRYMLNDGTTPGITQILPTGSPGPQIPEWKLLLHILDLEGANYEGRSLLRPAYMHYFYKKLYYRIDALAAQRQGMGFPVVHVPPQASSEDKAKAREIAQNIRVNEQSYADLPVGFTLEFIDTKGKNIKDVKEMVLHHNREELAAFKAQFLDLGATTAGSQNASSDQTELFYNALNYIARTYQDPTQLAIRELVDLNFSNVAPDEYPTLEYGGLGQLDFEKWSTALMRLAQGGFILPTDDDERHIRQVMTLPEGTRFSDEQEVDPETRRIPVPDPVITSMQGGGNSSSQSPQASSTGKSRDASLSGNTTVPVRERPVVRYAKEQARQRQMQFNEALEDMQELQLRVQDALDKKKPVKL